jgi:hypothetical protein
MFGINMLINKSFYTSSFVVKATSRYVIRFIL